MILFRKAFLYFHTIRHLKPVQIWGRMIFVFFHPKPDLRPAPEIRCSSGDWVNPVEKSISMLSETKFRFLNSEHDICDASDWNLSILPKLWLYNLHYFDDLNAKDASSRKSWHLQLIARWIRDNYPGTGVGWDSYPMSLRIINWIKWELRGNLLDKASRFSLAVQVRYLSIRLERHLLGNHLLTNAKALVFAGCYFQGKEADAWFDLGMKILEREVREQILEDGGHFERSTMYQLLSYEDMLDLVNLVKTYPELWLPWQASVSSWVNCIEKMGGWIRTMCHPDGEISFFNDSAIGIAPPPYALFAYADRVGILPVVNCGEVTWLKSSGYIRIALGDSVLLIDVAPVGPDYIPGHAHADTLSYEFSLYSQRVIVNSGTSSYSLGPIRKFERSTAAHSTIEIDGTDSSEVWAGFRVARRAYPFDISVEYEDHKVIVEASHNGYSRLRGKLIHRRRWCLHKDRLEVFDFIEGNFIEAISRVFFHPNLEVKKAGSLGKASWFGRSIDWEASVTNCKINSSFWRPGFGLMIPNSSLLMKINPSVDGPTCKFMIDWS